MISDGTVPFEVKCHDKRSENNSGGNVAGDGGGDKPGPENTGAELGSEIGSNSTSSSATKPKIDKTGEDDENATKNLSSPVHDKDAVVFY